MQIVSAIFCKCWSKKGDFYRYRR